MWPKRMVRPWGISRVFDCVSRISLEGQSKNEGEEQTEDRRRRKKKRAKKKKQRFGGREGTGV